VLKFIFTHSFLVLVTVGLGHWTGCTEICILSLGVNVQKSFENHWVRVWFGLGLWLRLGVGFRFTFCIYYVSTKPTAFSSCITVML